MQHIFLVKMELYEPENQPSFLFKRIQLKLLKIEGPNLYHWGAGKIWILRKLWPCWPPLKRVRHLSSRLQALPLPMPLPLPIKTRFSLNISEVNQSKKNRKTEFSLNTRLSKTPFLDHIPFFSRKPKRNGNVLPCCSQQPNNKNSKAKLKSKEEKRLF